MTSTPPPLPAERVSAPPVPPAPARREPGSAGCIHCGSTAPPLRWLSDDTDEMACADGQACLARIAASSPDVTVTVTDPKAGDRIPVMPLDPKSQHAFGTRPPVHHGPNPSPGWRNPLTWLAWLGDALGDLRWRVGRHRHFYQLIGASFAPVSLGAAMAGPSTAGVTTLAYRCFCSGPDQLIFIPQPGKWTVDDLTTGDQPPLISVSRARELRELAAVHEEFGARKAHAAKMDGF